MARVVAIVGCGLLSNLEPAGHGVWPLPPGPPASRQFAAFDAVLEKAAPERADRRAMGPAMQAGCCAAHLALSQAGLAGDRERLAGAHLLVAARMSERQDEIDAEALAALGDDGDMNRLAATLRDGLRPTFFLTQLSNLLAANISITQGVRGRSQTFLGNEGAGVDAVLTAAERIGDGGAERCLVGAVFRGDGACAEMGFEAVEALDGQPPRPAGSAAAFLVLEDLEAARARGAEPLAILASLSHAMADADVDVDVDGAGADAAITAGVADSPPQQDLDRCFGRLSEAAFPTALVTAVARLAAERRPGRVEVRSWDPLSAVAAARLEPAS